jgi:membrane protease YdiL (CAAX protease family)
MKVKSENLRKWVAIILVMLVGDIFIIVLLPKLIAWLFSQMEYPLNSDNNATRYLMGIGVRMLGFLLFLFLMKKYDMLKRYRYKLNRKDILISWMFFIYIAANIQMVSLKGVPAINVALMILDCFMVGLYEETIFRGFVLSLLLKGGNESRKQTIIAVVISSVTFGLMHLSNLSKTPLISVLYQVAYATIIGIAFSAVLLRTNWNLMWCITLHTLYDIADGFGDFLPKVENATPHKIELLPYVFSLLTFVPLLLYGLFLLRKVESSPIVEEV